MPINLEPSLVAFETALEKGALVLLPVEDIKGRTAVETGSFKTEILQFQYNPETITRNRTGEWKSREGWRDKGAATSDVQKLSEQGSASLMAKSETISMKRCASR